MLTNPSAKKEPIISALSSQGVPINALLIGRTQDVCIELQAALLNVKGLSVETLASVGELPKAFAEKRSHPQLLLVDVAADSAKDFDLIRDLRKVSWTEHIPIVALCDRAAQQLALQAMRSGADDVLLKPILVEEARDVLINALHSPRVARPAPVALGKVISFMHLTGGAGATTLAVNAACALALEGRDTCLIDLDIQFGNAASLLDLSAISPMQDFVDEPDRLDIQMLEGLALKHGSGLQVLTAPRRLLPLNAYGQDGLSKLLELAKQRYRYTIVDLPVALVAWTDAVLRSSAVIYLVVPLTVPSAQRVMKFLSLLQEEGLVGLPLKIVANRYVGSKFRSNDITVEQFEKAIGRKLDFLIPNDYALISLSQREGKPAVELKPKSAFSTAISELLAGDLGSSAAEEKSRGFFAFR